MINTIVVIALTLASVLAINMRTIESNFGDGITGLSTSLQKVLQNTITRYETCKVCSCLTYSGGTDLQKFDGQRWNVVCGAAKIIGSVGFGGIIYEKS